MNEMYFFLKKNRFRKKWKIYQRIWLLSFDITLVIYCLLAVGYVVAAIVLEGNLFSAFQDGLFKLDAINVENIGFLITALPLIYFVRAFNQPGILFSNAEFKLTTLTYAPKQIWFMLAIERWIRASIIFGCIGLCYFLFSKTSGALVLSYVFVLIFINMLMTVIEWKVYQLSFWKKLGIIGLFVGLNLLHFIVATLYVVGFLIGILLLLQLFCYSRLLSHIDWIKVTTAADYKLWNMTMVSYVTKVSFKKERKQTMWQQLSFWKKPFTFQKNTLYHRLWQIYFEKNLKYIVQIFGALLLMNMVLGFIKPWLFLIAIAITIHIYASLLAALFRDRFSVDLVQVLPWDLHAYKRSFLWWAYLASVPLYIPFIIYFLLSMSLWNLLLIAVIGFIFTVLIHDKTTKAIHYMMPTFRYSEIPGTCAYLALFFLLCSYPYPIAMLGSILMIVVIVAMKLRSLTS